MSIPLCFPRFRACTYRRRHWITESKSPDAEIIVVDAGSSDATCDKARQLCDQLIDGPRGRATQMNLGAKRASGAALAFIHADTIVPFTFASDIATALSAADVVGGRFDV